MSMAIFLPYIRGPVVIVVVLFSRLYGITHRDLKSDSHNRFPTRDFACWAYILNYGESKKGCLNYFRNRSAHIYWCTFVKYKG